MQQDDLFHDHHLHHCIVRSDLPVNLLSSLNDQIMNSPVQSVLENLSFHIVMLETAALYPQLSPLVCMCIYVAICVFL